jgi:methionine-rich copper-binding protein CopC
MPKAFRRLATLLLLGSVLGGAAQAHALLLSFKVEGPDAVLQYNGRIDATRSRFTLLTKDGAIVQKLDCSAGSDLATLKTSIKDIAPGTYVLRWEVLSVDGHLSRGDQPLVIPTP